MKKIISVILIIVLLTLNTSGVLAKNEQEKTIVVVLDHMDFKDSEKLINDKMSMGLLNIKTRGKNTDSLFMSINVGRKVSIPEESFKGLKAQGNGAVLKDYKEIKESLDKAYPNFSRQINFLGELLKTKKIKTSYIGSGNKSDILMLIDKNGKISDWQGETSYDYVALKEKIDKSLKESDVLLLSYDIKNDDKRLNTLSMLLEDMNDHRLIVFPRVVSGDIDHKLNNSIVPILYGTGETVGILSSKSTRREAVVTNLDISSTIASHFGLNLKTGVGSQIEISKKGDLIDSNEKILSEFLNLNLVKYIFHVLITLLSLYIVLVSKSKEKDFTKAKILLDILSISIILSIVLGIFHLHRYIFLYVSVILGLSGFLSFYIYKKNIKVIENIAFLTNILILIFVFLKPTYLYNSFIGYNSIIAGGRFYGFNNEIMGVLIVTSIMVYYQLKDKIQNTKCRKLLLIGYFPLVIMALTGGFGANFGGFLTSIVVFLVLLYLSFFDRKVNHKTILSLLVIGTLILTCSLYLDMKDAGGSHAGNLVERINLLGFYELLDMVIKKLSQLLYMTLVPPWSIGFLAQIYFIISRLKEIKYVENTIQIKFIVMFIGAVVALLVNDTGVVAFVYMNSYLINNLIEER